jgi:hypothetical protein
MCGIYYKSSPLVNIKMNLLVPRNPQALCQKWEFEPKEKNSLTWRQNSGQAEPTNFSKKEGLYLLGHAMWRKLHS